MNLERFMELHRQFMAEEEPLKNEALCSELQTLLSELDDVRDIKNPLHSSDLSYGYVAIAHSFVINKDGAATDQILKGDVLILQYNWDRNIIVTKLPLSQTCPIPFLLKDTGLLTGLKGIWLPVFDPRRLRTFAERQIKKYTLDVSKFFDQEEKWWSRQISQES